MSTPRSSGSQLGLPLAQSLVALPPDLFQMLQRAVATLFRIAHLDAFQAHVDADACPVARHRPGNFGVMMGYDFHLTPEGPRLIEINTNAGGALVNALHSASVVGDENARCLCRDWMPVARRGERIVDTFRQECVAARADAELRRLAIVDLDPTSQFLYPEFELYRELFRGVGIDAEIVDSRALRASTGSGTPVGGLVSQASDRQPFDLVYWRDTDFMLEEERNQPLRQAWLAGQVVLTPAPREHHLLADKRRMQLFSDRAGLRELGASAAEAELLARVVPETLPLEALGVAQAWSERKGFVFKPAAAFGSRAVYRGDKISRRKLEELFRLGGFVAQRAVAPGQIDVRTPEGTVRMKFDVRAYVYRDEILLLGARAYQGQVTTMRTPGGGFSAICVSA